jgi:hypothetical protein
MMWTPDLPSDQRCHPKVNGEGDRPISDQPNPSSNIRQGNLARLCQLCIDKQSASSCSHSEFFDQGHTVAPVARTSGRRVSRCELAQRERYTLVEDKYDYPSEEHAKLPSTVDGGDQRRSFSIGHCCDGE